jgi:radical SAM superfamily enzyme YgiQ (UPF0313 family)
MQSDSDDDDADNDRPPMKVLLVHPSSLMYSDVYLRLEPLGLEQVGGALRKAGHDVRLIDLQIFRHRDFLRRLDQWRPDAVAFSLNYLANIPEVLDLARATRERLPDAFVFAGGHSVSFIAAEVLKHADGAIDCILRGEGEAAAPQLLAAFRDGDVSETTAGRFRAARRAFTTMAFARRSCCIILRASSSPRSAKAWQAASIFPPRFWNSRARPSQTACKA